MAYENIDIDDTDLDSVDEEEYVNDSTEPTTPVSGAPGVPTIATDEAESNDNLNTTNNGANGDTYNYHSNDNSSGAQKYGNDVVTSPATTTGSAPSVSLSAFIQEQSSYGTLNEWKYRLGYGSYDSNDPEVLYAVAVQEKIFGETGKLATAFSESVTEMIDDWSGNAFCPNLGSLLSQYGDFFTVGNLNLATALGPLQESVQNAKVVMESVAEDVAEEYARVAAEKEAILRRRAEEAAAAKRSSGN